MAKGEGDAGMTYLLLHDPRIHALTQHDSGVNVAEVLHARRRQVFRFNTIACWFKSYDPVGQIHRSSVSRTVTACGPRSDLAKTTSCRSMLGH